MYINALCRATVCVCVLAISLSLHAAAVSYNTTYKAASSSISARPALAAFVREVLDSNPGVQAAEAAVNTAQALTRAASRPLYNPELEVQAERAIENTGALGLSQTIDWADKRAARTQVASFDQTAARARVAAVRQRLAGKILSALNRFWTAKPLLRLAERRLSLTRLCDPVGTTLQHGRPQQR
jgi:cobalt-zinc-cadmium efflux system outer membrane protein